MIREALRKKSTTIGVNKNCDELNVYVPTFLYVRVDYVAFKKKKPIGLAALKKRKSLWQLSCVRTPYNKKGKQGLKTHTNILCYKLDIYLVILPGEQTVLMGFLS